MPYIYRGLIFFMAATALILGAYFLFLDRDVEAGPGGSAIASLPMDEYGQELQAQIDCSQDRNLGKRAIVQELLAERLTLRQAAAGFQELNATAPEPLLALWRKGCPGDTDEERYCWTVLRYVGAELLHQLDQGCSVRERLARELPDHLCRRLPKDLRLIHRQQHETRGPNLSVE
jgi:hypothetical protein